MITLQLSGISNRNQTSYLCFKLTSLICSTRLTSFPHAAFAPPFPHTLFWLFHFPLPPPPFSLSLSLSLSFTCSPMPCFLCLYIFNVAKDSMNAPTELLTLFLLSKPPLFFSGESGAGKTESTKLLIQQLISLGPLRSTMTLEQRIIQVRHTRTANWKKKKNRQSSHFRRSSSIEIIASVTILFLWIFFFLHVWHSIFLLWWNQKLFCSVLGFSLKG